MLHLKKGDKVPEGFYYCDDVGVHGPYENKELLDPTGCADEFEWITADDLQDRINDIDEDDYEEQIEDPI